MVFDDARLCVPLDLAPHPFEAWLRGATSVAQALEAARRAGVGASDTELLVELLRLDAAGRLRLMPVIASPPLRELHARMDAGEPAGDLLLADPSLHYVAGDAGAWREAPGDLDPVGADGPIGLLKRYELDLYLRHLDPFLAALPAGARVLDAGCGAGRLAAHLAPRDLRLCLVDASPTALKRAVLHGLEAGARGIEAYVADVRDLGFLDADAFDLSVALEVLCYQEEPHRGLAELARVTRPGGHAAVSMEGLYGGLLSEPRLDLGRATGLLADPRLLVEGDVLVAYQTAESLSALLDEAGLDCALLEGTHYLSEGPLDRLLSWEALADPAARAAALRLELACAADPVLRPLARAWLAVGRVR